MARLDSFRLKKNIVLRRIVGAGRSICPGLAVVGVVAAAAMHLGALYSAPVMLYALLLGLSLHFLASEETKCLAGIEFASQKLLRIGVSLLGLQISIPEIYGLGIETLGIVAAGVILTIAFGIVISHALGRGIHLGVLTGGAVAICGASAAIAIAAAMPQQKLAKGDLLFTVAAVTTLSTLAMVIYPLLISMFGFSDRSAGILLGGTIHDVAQVVGAGYAVSDLTGHIATAVKLLRVALLMPIVIVVSWCFRGRSEDGRSRLINIPGFAVAFAGLVVLNSFDVVPMALHDALASLSRWLLVTAISAIGMLTSLRSIAEIGSQHILIMIGETVWLLVIVLGTLIYLS